MSRNGLRPKRVMIAAPESKGGQHGRIRNDGRAARLQGAVRERAGAATRSEHGARIPPRCIRIPTTSSTSFGNYAFTDASGEKAEFDVSAGAVFWMEATEHATDNAGNTTIRALMFEPK
jgi:hypothetical protein